MTTPKTAGGWVVLAGVLAATAACETGEVADDSAPELVSDEDGLRPGPGGPGDGQELFERETFRGNGRTCATCHGDRTGTLSPREIQGLDRRDTIFRGIDADVVGGKQ